MLSVRFDHQLLHFVEGKKKKNHSRSLENTLQMAEICTHTGCDFSESDLHNVQQGASARRRDETLSGTESQNQLSECDTDTDIWK